MKKQILSLFIITSLIMPTGLVFAEEAPNIEFTPQEMTYSTQYPVPKQTQYPVPVNSYQNQGYDSNMYEGGYYNSNSNDNNDSNLKGKVVMVPADTMFSATTMSPISSETMQKGDSVTMYLSSDFYYGKHLIAVAGSRVNGVVLNVSRGGMANRNGKVNIKFTNIVTPYGQMIPINANIRTDDGSGVLKGGTAKDVAKDYARDAVIGAGIGAALGTAMGALASGSVGKGAIYGTALGGGMALLATTMQRGETVEVPQGATLDIVITQPITVSINNP